MPTTIPQAVITSNGLNAAAVAGTLGPLITIGAIRLGSRSLAQGGVATDADTDVDDFVRELPISALRYQVNGAGSVTMRVHVDDTEGDYFIGQVGLKMPDGTLLAKAVYPQQIYKYKSNLPAVQGNHEFFDFEIKLSNVANILSFTNIIALYASLPESATELTLPSYSSTPYNAWKVINHTKIGQTCLAFTTPSGWAYAPLYKDPRTDTNIIVAQNPGSDFHVDAAVDKYVYWDEGAAKYKPWSSGDSDRIPLGLRTSSYEITTYGYFKHTGTPYTAGALYYVDSGTSAGVLTTINTGEPIAFALSTSELWIFGRQGTGGSEGLLAAYFNRRAIIYRFTGVPLTWGDLVDGTLLATNQRLLITQIKAVNRGTATPARIFVRMLDSSRANAPVWIAPGLNMDPTEIKPMLSAPMIMMKDDKIQVMSDEQELIDVILTCVPTDDLTLKRVTLNMTDSSSHTLHAGGYPSLLQKWIIASVLVANPELSVYAPFTWSVVVLAGGVYTHAYKHPVPPQSSVEFAIGDISVPGERELRIAGGVTPLDMIISYRDMQ